MYDYNVLEKQVKERLNNPLTTEVGIRAHHIDGTYPWSRYCSSPRAAMSMLQRSQGLSLSTVNGGLVDIPYWHNTATDGLRNTTISVRAPCDLKIIDVVKKYPNSKNNPLTYAVYYSLTHRYIGLLELPKYMDRFDTRFGFMYKEVVEGKLKIGAVYEKDESIIEPQSIYEDYYSFGMLLNTLFISHRLSNEDALLVNEDTLKKRKFVTHNTTRFNVGGETYLANIFGDDEEYRPLDVIGSVVKNGLLAVKKEYDGIPISATMERAREHDVIFDTEYLAPTGSIIQDITVKRQAKVRNSLNYWHKQLDDLSLAYLTFQRNLQYAVDRGLEEYGLTYSPETVTDELHTALVWSKSLLLASVPKNNISLQHKVRKINGYQVIIKTLQIHEMGVRFKMTDLIGGKGINCNALPASEMPCTKDGIVADVVAYGGATTNRTNIGRLHEQDVTFMAMQVEGAIREIYGLPRYEGSFGSVAEAKAFVQREGKDKLSKAYTHYLLFITHFCPDDSDVYVSATHDEKVHVIGETLHIHIIAPLHIDNPYQHAEAMEAMEKIYKPVVDQVYFTSHDGRRRLTKNPCIIAPIYYLALNRIGDNFNVCSVRPTSHYDIPSKMSTMSNRPHRDVPTRNQGESESRASLAYNGPATTYEEMSRNTTAALHEISKSILYAPNPARIERAVSKETLRLPTGPLKVVRLINNCFGCDFVYVPPKGVYK